LTPGRSEEFPMHSLSAHLLVSGPRGYTKLTVFYTSLVLPDALGDVVVFPLEGFRGLVVEPDIAQDLACEVLDGGKDPANDDRVAGVDNAAHLRASHCKPWRDSNNDERLDGENGLLLAPSIDHLFDRGSISFQRDGGLIISPVAHRASLARMGVPTDQAVNVGAFSDRQDRFLEYHRDAVLLRSVR
jgi:hypothetical protein